VWRVSAIARSVPVMHELEARGRTGSVEAKTIVLERDSRSCPLRSGGVGSQSAKEVRSRVAGSSQMGDTVCITIRKAEPLRPLRNRAQRSGFPKTLASH
jgi:hypothetical protein